jgi:hypothetical protein
VLKWLRDQYVRRLREQRDYVGLFAALRRVSLRDDAAAALRELGLGNAPIKVLRDGWQLKDPFVEGLLTAGGDFDERARSVGHAQIVTRLAGI